MDDVPVLDNIFLALQTQTTGTLSAAFAIILNVVFVTYHFGFNETLLEVSMNDARSLWCTDAVSNGPGPGFFRACREIGL